MSPSNGLPPGWTLSKVSDAFEINPGKPPANAFDPRTPVSFVPMSAVDAESATISNAQSREFGVVRKGYTAFSTGDVLLAKITPCFENGKAAVAKDLVNGVGFGSTEFHVFRGRGTVLPEFLLHFLRRPGFRDDAKGHMTGTAGQARVPVAYLSDLTIPVPPLSEQRVIVGRIEELLAQAKVTIARLHNAARILQRLRASLITVAASGALTGDWRESNVLDRVRGPSISLVDDEIENTSDFMETIPSTWSLAPLEDVCDAVIDYRGRTPPTTTSGIPHVRTGNIKSGVVDLDTEDFVSRSTYERFMTRGLPRRGDVLFTMEAPLGETAVIETDREFSIAQRILLLRGDRRFVGGEFLAMILTARQVRMAIEARATGSTVLGIAYKRLKFVEIPLPPLAEQDEILRRVKSFLIQTSAVEARTTRALASVEQLPQVLLEKAFSGELVRADEQPIEPERKASRAVSVG